MTTSSPRAVGAARRVPDARRAPARWRLPGPGTPGPGDPAPASERPLAQNPAPPFVFAGAGPGPPPRYGCSKPCSSGHHGRRRLRAPRSAPSTPPASPATPPRPASSAMATLWRNATSADVFPQGRIPATMRFSTTRGRPFERRTAPAHRGGLTFERIEEAPVTSRWWPPPSSNGRTQWFTYGPRRRGHLASAACLTASLRQIGTRFHRPAGGRQRPIGRGMATGRAHLRLSLRPLRYTPHRYRRRSRPSSPPSSSPSTPSSPASSNAFRPVSR